MSGSESEEAAAAAAAKIIEGDEAQETASGSETEQQEPEFPSFDIELPADLAAELEEEEEVEVQDEDEELEVLVEEHGEDNRELARQLVKERKRAQYLEGLRAKEARKTWEEEAKKFFPLSEPFLNEINATSRRGYLRTAKLLNEKMKPIVEEKVLAPARAAIEAEKTKATTEAKQEARKAWGTSTRSDQAPREGTVSTNVEYGRRRRQELSDTIRMMIFNQEE